MTGFPTALQAHLETGITSVCRCWQVVRRDGVRFGFTDHDSTLAFDGQVFVASEGMSARAFEQTTGLAVDNSEALGVLSDVSVSEEDILAGLFDGAEVLAWLVNWADPAQRVLQFRGAMGEIQRAAGAFRAELRGLTEALNQPQGRVYQAPCAAVLGDSLCRFDLNTPGYVETRAVEAVEGRKFFRFAALDGFDDRWFERGRLIVQSGAAKGIVAIIKNDRLMGTGRTIEVWEALRLEIAPGDIVRLEAGCDKRVESCRLKFNNINNFRGFPDIPGEDWLMAYPRSGDDTGGGSLTPRRQVRALPRASGGDS
ncbi:DUF2163 domain-containing protein [Oceaniglobus ichthyenteri]|uniref:DUF2163 domain-containing protein n=1 Tax=Oceaniglobus ichthyenteri TaxID=2136177 RepID=UPI000D3518CB|nr:DUF2163 domain-containing protein [Oceaniglobus ichthyenteri]